MSHATRIYRHFLNNVANLSKSNSSKPSTVARYAANRSAFDKALRQFSDAETALECLPDRDWIGRTPALCRREAESSRAYLALRAAPAPDIGALIEKVRAMLDDGDAARVILVDLERLAGMSRATP